MERSRVVPCRDGKAGPAWAVGVVTASPWNRRQDCSQPPALFALREFGVRVRHHKSIAAVTPPSNFRCCV
jgi:hypothetical protein